MLCMSLLDTKFIKFSLFYVIYYNIDDQNKSGHPLGYEDIFGCYLLHTRFHFKENGVETFTQMLQ